jgi:hypothetical protein
MDGISDEELDILSEIEDALDTTIEAIVASYIDGQEGEWSVQDALATELESGTGDAIEDEFGDESDRYIRVFCKCFRKVFRDTQD